MKSESRDRYMVPVLIGISIIAPLLMLALVYLPLKSELFSAQMESLPFFHASLNFTTSILLLMGYLFARMKKYKIHRAFMLTAFVLSCVFLVSYVISKINSDPVPFGGEGAIRYLYFFILITHILLSAVIVPLVLFTIYRGLTGEFVKHKKIAKWTLPVWLYVSITGVLVYVFMVPYY
ncbi:MAG TPA: DUF420 domain-containing protein [Salinimicrobium sp.]|nr:DUF420 domain-containing protein [Salinimicrobium sp.]